MSKRENKKKRKGSFGAIFNSCIDTDFPSVDIQHLYP